MYKYLTICLLIATAHAILRSSHFAKLGIDVKDGVLQKESDVRASIQTVCNDVNLNVKPYNYNGIVRSGYLSVGKGNSALSFIFYGKQGASL